MAIWQREQSDNIKDSLPLQHVLCVHDFSENYHCAFQDEVQSQYFCRNEVSIHVITLYRHSLSEYDGEESTAENPIIVK